MGDSLSRLTEYCSLTRHAGHNSFDDNPWIVRLVEYTKQVLAQSRVRIIGVCFGHQIVGRALGQRVYRGEAGWEVSVLPIDLSHKGKELFRTETLVLQPPSSLAPLTADA